MIRFVFRFVGLWILAAGFVALVRDGTKSIAGNAVFITKLATTGTTSMAPAWSSLKAWSSAMPGPALWEFASAYVLAAPTWLVLGIIGSILILIGRKKKPLIGYGRD